MASRKKFIIAMHVGGWLVLFCLLGLFIYGQSRNSSLVLSRPLSILSFTVYIIIFYLHTGVLFPKLYLGRKYVLYFLSISFLFTAVFFLKPFDRLVSQQGPPAGNADIVNGPPPRPGLPRPPGNSNEQPPGGREGRPVFDIVSIAIFFLIIALSIALVMERRWQAAVEKAARAEADKANAELSFLKAQINPHFLFNTLNNLYSLAMAKDEHTAPAIMQLSYIMRYVTDDAMQHMVDLQSEVDCISNYIELQKLRLSSKTQLHVELTADTEGRQIAPLILMTFVENVFKYGVSSNESSPISIKLSTEGQHITFFCQNKLFPRKNDSTGIGINNTKKRLEQLYPGRYTLSITEEQEFFTVKLVLI